jgi:hypothetical protein
LGVLTRPFRKLGFVLEHPILGEFSWFSGVPDLIASWKFVRTLDGFSIRRDSHEAGDD